jgi:hypothetical protein
MLQQNYGDNFKNAAQNGFNYVFYEWQKRWDKCIEFRGTYLEKEHICNNSEKRRYIKKIFSVFIEQPLYYNV